MRKFLLLGLFLSCLQQVLMAAYDDDVSTESIQLLESCGSENGLRVNDLYNIATLHLDDQETPENFKCTMKCVLFNKGLVNEQGRLRVDDILADTPDPETKNYLFELLNNCSNVDGDTPCQRAFNAYRCLVP